MKLNELLNKCGGGDVQILHLKHTHRVKSVDLMGFSSSSSSSLSVTSVFRR